MKCPLSITGELAPNKEFIGAAADCLKEECAWWIAGDERCSVLVAAAHLVGLVAIGDRLLDKMPHEEQFRK